MKLIIFMMNMNLPNIRDYVIPACNAHYSDSMMKE